jgi:8-oxo-dGTP pyrophosphatase MutT (NUDIX family)
MTRLQTPHPQAAAIPVRAGRICLVTSRGGDRLVVPKGRLERGRTPEQIALQEAWEEAGLIGHLHSQPIGSYHYQKAGLRFEVVMFRMEVTTVVKDWPESGWRLRHWLRPADAAARVRVRGLRKLIRKAMAQMERKRPVMETSP